jgi:hypothetical protein
LHSSDALYGHARACIPPSAGNHAHGFWQLRVGRVLEHEPHRVGVERLLPERSTLVRRQHHDLVCAAPDQARIRPPRCPVVNQPRVKQKHVRAKPADMSQRNREGGRLGEHHHPVIRLEHKPQAAVQARVVLAENNANQRLAGLAPRTPSAGRNETHPVPSHPTPAPVTNRA